MKNWKFLIIISLLFLLSACSKIIFREVECRGFSNYENLKLFGGQIGDTITFKKQDDELIKFVIEDKYIHHITKYTSDTGCGCHDSWGVFMKTDNNDTIGFYNGIKYVEDNDANKYDYFFIKVGDISSTFRTNDVSLIENYSVDNINFTNVTKYNYAVTDNLQFNTIYVANEIGIVEMIRNNGEVWVNNNLTEKLDTDINSFIFSEDTCE